MPQAISLRYVYNHDKWKGNHLNQFFKFTEFQSVFKMIHLEIVAFNFLFLSSLEMVSSELISQDCNQQCVLRK